ncbi:thrombospondin type 3 repeat-containing protein [Candidatus Woesebacteria bacterium]|nr:thrombospondin type 3 repeat-containing protein [Candidatus Woesebacteria bacterium]
MGKEMKMQNNFLLKSGLIFTAIVIASTLLFNTTVKAANNPDINDPQTVFQQQSLLVVPSLQIPTVVELELPRQITDEVFIYNSTTQSFIGTRFLTTTNNLLTPVRAQIATDEKPEMDASPIIDRDTTTYLDLLPNALSSSIILQYPKKSNIGGIELLVARDSSFGERISIYYADSATTRKPILVEDTIRSKSISFPTVESDTLYIQITHSQPIRLTDITTTSATGPTKRAIQFLAQPGAQYVAYTNAIKVPQIRATESIAVESSSPMKVSLQFTVNPLYVEPDTDGDGLIDSVDNCTSKANSDQADVDRNGVGDACEDFDADGIPNALDNCPSESNRDQIDTDGDTVGDVCDELDNRITERYGWLPWLGIGVAVGVLLFVVFRTITQPNSSDESGVLPANDEPTHADPA